MKLHPSAMDRGKPEQAPFKKQARTTLLCSGTGANLSNTTVPFFLPGSSGQFFVFIVGRTSGSPFF